MTLSHTDIARLHAITPTHPPRPVAPVEPPPAALALYHDRLLEAMSERERFEMVGVPYSEAKR